MRMSKERCSLPRLRLQGNFSLVIHVDPMGFTKRSGCVFCLFLECGRVWGCGVEEGERRGESNRTLDEQCALTLNVSSAQNIQ